MYKATSVRTGSLMLDPKNARLPAELRSTNQRALLQALLEYEDVKGLAQSIAKLGLFPNERLVVMHQDQKYIVLEGNRRLAAVKLLLNPELAPTETQVRLFRRLSDRANLQELSKMDVVIVKDRTSAAPIIAALHIGHPKKSWSALQQARFYRDYIDQGITPADAAEHMGVTLGEVQSYLRADLLHRLAATLEYDPETRRKIDDPKFPITTLERFVDSKIGRRALGLEVTSDGNLRGIVHPDRFKAVLGRVAKDVATTDGLTRTVNDEDGMTRYFQKIERDLPDTPKRGGFDPRVLLGESPGSSAQEENPEQERKRPKTPKISSSVIPIGYACDSSKHERVRAIFGELKSMKIEGHRNSTGIMLRVLIDVALWQFIVDKGLSDAVRSHFDPNSKKRNYDPTWTPPLRDLLSYMCDQQQFPGMDAAGYKAVRLLAGRTGNDIITIDGFNAYTHNPHVSPTEAELRALWQRAQPMLDVILN